MICFRLNEKANFVSNEQNNSELALNKNPPKINPELDEQDYKSQIREEKLMDILKNCEISKLDTTKT